MTPVIPVNTNSIENAKLDYVTRFKSNSKTRLVSVEQIPDYEVRTYEVKASAGKKWGVGLASYFCPGLGQGINGQWGKGVGFFLGYIATGLMTAFGMGNKNIAALTLGGISMIGINVWSIIDAVKNAYSTKVQFVPLKNSENTLNMKV